MRVLSSFVGCTGCLESDECSAAPRGRGRELEAGSWLAGVRPSLASSGPWARCVCMAWGSEGEASKEEEDSSSIWHVLCNPRRDRITLSLR